MSDNFWKDQYQNQWLRSAKRERAVKEYIEKKTGFEVEDIGLGAGSTEYLSGSAASRGYTRGGSDFRIKGTNIEIEVTGDLTGKIDKSQPLWIRPDKIRATFKNPNLEKWVIHHLAKDNTSRAIQLDKNFLERYAKNGLRTVRPMIRGVREEYVEVPATDPCVRPFREFMNRLRMEKARLDAERDDDII